MENEKRSYYEKYWQKDNTSWSPHDQRPSSVLIDAISKLVQPGMYVLDYGCGDCSKCGDLITSLGATYVGVDLSLTALRDCKKRNYKAILCSDETYLLPFTENAFDLILCLEVLEHLFRPDLALQNMIHVLKPNGFLVISVPNIAWIGNRLLMILGFFNPGGSPETSFRAPWRDPHVRFFTKQSLYRLISQEANMEIVLITGEDFSLSEMPFFYKSRKLKSITKKSDFLFRSLGQHIPSIFTGNFVVVARKTK